MDMTDRQAFTRGLVYVLLRRWGLMAAIFGAVLFLFLFAGYLLTPTWEAEVLLLAEQTAAPVKTPFGSAGTPAPAADSSENLSLMLGGKGLAYDMVRQFGLDERLRRKVQDPPTMRDSIKMAIVRVAMSPYALLEALGILKPGEPDWVDRAAKDFREGFTSWLEVKALPDSQVVSLKIHGETPQLATDIANAMVVRARERLVEATARASDETREAYRSELEAARQKVDAAEAELQAFQEAQGGVTLSEDIKAKTLDLQDLTAEESRLSGEILVLERQLAEAALDPERTVSINSGSIAENPVIQNLRSQLHDEEVKLGVMVTERTPEHPDVINLNEEIAGLRDALRTEILNVVRRLGADRERTRAEIADLREELVSLPAKDLALAELTMAVNIYRGLYQGLLQTSEEMEVMAQAGISALDFKVLDHAHVSSKASSDFPSMLIILVVGCGVAAGAAIGLPLFLEYWRDPVKGAFDLERQEIEVLGVIPRVGRP
jgi:uncharacterized protein involved in exopolysaccharide biosynthesis